MLKIKDNVDLKELEKIGVKKIKNYDDKYFTLGEIYVSCFETIMYYGYEAKDDYNDGLNILYDLIKANLVEKVEE